MFRSLAQRVKIPCRSPRLSWQAMRMEQLRPLGIGEILDVAMKIYRRNAVVMMIPVALVVGPLQVISGLIAASAGSGSDADEFRRSINSIGDPGNDFTTQANPQIDIEYTQVAASLSIVALELIVTTLATAVCFKIVIDVYLGRKPDWRESLRFSTQRLRSLFWVVILTYLVAGLAFIPLIAPGIWLLVSWIAATPVLLAEGVRGRSALGRSFALVRGRWWPTFGTYFIGAIAVGMVTGLMTTLLFAVLFSGIADGGLPGFLISAVVGTVSGVITTPFMAALVAVIYFDLRVRKEGFDLELLAAGVGVTPPDDATAPQLPPLLPPQAPRYPNDDQPPYWPPPPGWKPRSPGSQ